MLSATANALKQKVFPWQKVNEGEGGNLQPAAALDSVRNSVAAAVGAHKSAACHHKVKLQLQNYSNSCRYSENVLRKFRSKGKSNGEEVSAFRKYERLN